MSVVDSHMHVNFKGLSIKGIIKYLDKERIDCCWLLRWEGKRHKPWNTNHLHSSVKEIYDAYLKYPSRIIPFYSPDPDRDDVGTQLEDWHQLGIRGCGELKETLNWDSERVRSILQAVRRMKIPLVFHMEEGKCRNIPYSDAIYDKILFQGLGARRKIYQIPQKVLQILVKNFSPLRNRNRYYVFPGYMLDFSSLEAALQDYPDINFVAHGPMFWKHISDDAATRSEMYPKGPVSNKGLIWRLLSDYPNLYADTSGESGLNALTRDPANAKRFLSLYEDKILYGTDNFINKGQRDFLDSLGLPQKTYKKIYGGNACKLIEC